MIALFKNLSLKKELFIKLAYLIEPFIVLIILIITYCRGVQDVPFTGDESHWIATSYYFEALFNRELIPPSLSQNDSRIDLMSTPVWGDNYWTLTQPPLTRYIIAIGRLSGGYQVKDLNAPYDWAVDPAKNQTLGTLPSPWLLWWSRIPMTLLAAFSGLIFFLLVRNCSGRISGYAFVVLFINMSYFLTNLRHAMGESPLLFFTGLIIVAGAIALAKWEQIRQ
jgi:hypothetical protein